MGEEDIPGPGEEAMRCLTEGDASALWISQSGTARRRYYNRITEEYTWGDHPTQPSCDDTGRMYVCMGSTRVTVECAVARVWGALPDGAQHYRGTGSASAVTGASSKLCNTDTSPRVQRAVECLRRCEPAADFSKRCCIQRGTAWSYLYSASQLEPLDTLRKYMFATQDVSLLLHLDTLAHTRPRLLGGPLSALVCHCDSHLALTSDKFGEIRLARYYIMKAHDLEEEPPSSPRVSRYSAVDGPER